MSDPTMQGRVPADEIQMRIDAVKSRIESDKRTLAHHQENVTLYGGYTENARQRVVLYEHFIKGNEDELKRLEELMKLEDIALLTELAKPLTPEQFDALPEKERRLLVVQDLLQRIEAEKLLIARSNYFSLNGRDINSPGLMRDAGMPWDGDLRDAVTTIEEEKGISCTVCAVGGLFYSALMLRDELTFAEVKNGSWGYEADGFRAKMLGFFSQAQLSLIELAFETAEEFMHFELGVTLEEVQQAYQFGYLLAGPRHETERITPADRLKFILLNVQDNDGVFVPSDLRRIPADRREVRDWEQENLDASFRSAAARLRVYEESLAAAAS
jgi:hypothetical protein